MAPTSDGEDDFARGEALEPPRRVLLVCLGNTCRSPMAAALLSDLASRTPGLDGLRVESAGTDVRRVRPASPGAVQAMAARGLGLDGHESRGVTREILSGVDLVLAMETAHRKAIERRFPESGVPVRTLGEVAGLAGRDVDVADPHGTSDEAYRSCAARIEELLRRALPSLAKGVA